MLQENICLTLLPKNAHGITQRPTLLQLHVDINIPIPSDFYTGILKDKYACPLLFIERNLSSVILFLAC